MVNWKGCTDWSTTGRTWRLNRRRLTVEVNAKGAELTALRTAGAAKLKLALEVGGAPAGHEGRGHRGGAGDPGRTALHRL